MMCYHTLKALLDIGTVTRQLRGVHHASVLRWILELEVIQAVLVDP